MTDTNEAPLRSPCVSICALDENNVCLGCYRTGQEITDWGSMTNDQRREVMQLVGERERAAMNFFSVDASSE
ncbi:MAG: DUF1289 domain-containing protein [Pseudomonadota bacterium]|nr:DUF1289 domain-containing protein [Pseudomonadota bacterium]MEC9409097.1 DUF1289 domain-containing protein [Pseudomonadota bacterium]MEE3161236.1 DUF1289 domain-containing protein [Pseudomonadota bacterium]